MHLENGMDTRTARKSTSRKQIQFAPLQLGRISEQPQKSPSADAMGDELLSPGRSKSLGAAVDRALLKGSTVAESAVSKDRPQSATQFCRRVGVTPHPAPPPHSKLQEGRRNPSPCPPPPPPPCLIHPTSPPAPASRLSHRCTSAMTPLSNSAKT